MGPWDHETKGKMLSTIVRDFSRSLRSLWSLGSLSLLFVALLQIIGKSNKATTLFTEHSAHRGAIFIPQRIGYLLEGHALMAHRACLLRPIITLLVMLPE